MIQPILYCCVDVRREKMKILTVSLISILVILTTCSKDGSGGQTGLKASGDDLKNVNDATFKIYQDPYRLKGSARAEFQFELDTGGVWKWNHAPENSMEYSWFVTFEVDGKSYEVGYSLYSFADGGSNEGGLEEMISMHGQNDFWSKNEEEYKAVDGIAPTSVVNEKGVLITIANSDIFDELRDSGETKANLKTSGYFIGDMDKDIEIQYINE